MSSQQLASKILRLLASSDSSEKRNVRKRKEKNASLVSEEKSVNPFALVRKQNGRLGGGAVEKKLKSKQRKERAINRQTLEYYQQSARINKEECELKSKVFLPH